MPQPARKPARRAFSFPKLTFKLGLLVALWAVYLAWMVYGLLLAPDPPAVNMRLHNYYKLVTALDFWGLIAALVFAFFSLNPVKLYNKKRLVFGTTALATMLGRLSGSGIALLPMALSAPIPSSVLYAITPVLMLFAGIFTIVTMFLLVGGFFTVFFAVPAMLFNQIFALERNLAKHSYKSEHLAGKIAGLFRWLRNEEEPEGSPDESKGARFATDGEMQKLHNDAVNDAAAMVFGHWLSRAGPFYTYTDKHVLIMASTRSGKGVSLIVPHLLRYKGSAFVLDPKGENAKATGRQRARLNGVVHYLDPFGISGKPQSRFNPLSRFTPDNMEAESKALAAALFLASDRERDHWNAAGQQLLAALILYVYVSPKIQPARKDLPTVRKILLGGIQQALKDMVTITAADGLLSDLATSFIETPEKEFGSIVSTAQRQTEILDNPAMIACLSAAGPSREVDFKAWHRGTMTVYLCLSAPKFPTFNRWLRLVLTSALDEMTDTQRPPKLPVCFMLDELATLGHLASVENAIGLAAGYGIQLVTIFQDVAQMRDLYKGRWASFISNSGVRAVFNLDDYDTAEYWSKFIGNRLVEGRSRQEDKYGYNQSENVSESMRPLMAPEKLMMEFASGKMLVLAQGTPPIKTLRLPYFLDETLVGLWDDPRTPVTIAPAQPVRPPPVPTPSPAPTNDGGPRPSPSAAPKSVPVAAARPTSVAGVVKVGYGYQPNASSPDTTKPATKSPAATHSDRSTNPAAKAAETREDAMSELEADMVALLGRDG